ncbi:MAG: hypothetical protein VST69_00490 [Nitrospirota bacterium]|nr:hypothetical protein [Nitrospirota bacterium]
MSRLKITVFILLSSFFLFPTFVQAVKPRPPIQLMFQEDVLSETETEITLIAHTNMDTDSVSLSMTLPPDLLLVEGETEWEGPMSGGEEQRITVKILKPDTLRSVIEGRAILNLPNDGVFEQYNHFVLKESPQKILKPTPQMKQKGNDESIIEFR